MKKVGGKIHECYDVTRLGLGCERYYLFVLANRDGKQKINSIRKQAAFV